MLNTQCQNVTLPKNGIRHGPTHAQRRSDLRSKALPNFRAQIQHLVRAFSHHIRTPSQLGGNPGDVYKENRETVMGWLVRERHKTSVTEMYQ
jgi:hypothetical protein